MQVAEIEYVMKSLYGEWSNNQVDDPHEEVYESRQLKNICDPTEF